MKVKILIDIDGTLYSTAKRMVDIIKRKYPLRWNGGHWRDIEEHGFKPVLDLNEFQIQKVFNRKDFYLAEYVMKDSIDVINKWLLKGYEIEFLTVGTLWNNNNKALLLDDLNFVKPVSLLMMSNIGTNKVSMNKGFYDFNNDRKEYLNIMIDDRLECLKTVRGTSIAIQMREQGYVLKSDKNHLYPKVTNWKELEKRIDGDIYSMEKCFYKK